MDGPRLVLDGGDDRLYVGGGERVDEVHADRRDDLIRTEVDREQAVRPLDARLPARDRADRRDHLRVGRLTDEEPLALTGEEHGDDTEQKPDADGRDTVQHGTAQRL